MADDLAAHLAERIAAACDLLTRGREVGDELIDDDLARAQALNGTVKNAHALLLGALVDLIEPGGDA